MIDRNNSSPQLAERWVWTRLGEVASLNPKFVDDISDELEVSFIPMKCLGELTGQVDLSLTKRYSEVKKGYTAFRNGDVIFAKITPCMENGKVGIVNDLKNGIGFGSTEFHVIRLFNGQMPNKFLFFFLVRESFRRDARMHMTGSAGQLRVPKNYLEEVSFPLPPLPEQHRIVAKIEELVTRVDAGVEGLKKVKAQLKVYRQAVLKHAFEGKMTKEWWEAHKGQMEAASVLLERITEERNKYNLGKPKGLIPLDTSDLPELPEGWVWTRLSEISEIILGQSPPSSTYNENGNGLPFYQGKLEFGDIYPTARKWCSSPKKIAEKGDVLISVRAPVGPTNICPDKSCIGRGLAAIRGLNGIETVFMLYLMRAFAHNLSLRRTGTTFDAITGDVLREFTIPLPPLAEQHKIVEEIERCFSIADEAEKVVEQSLKQAERLRQSILKRAFEGKLVPQDPTDEPAEKLLERIKVEKAKREVEEKATGRAKSRLNTIQGGLM